MDYVLLSDTEQRAEGLPVPAQVALADQVHHDECDALNHVNNTRYMVWFERLRIAFMEHLEISELGALDAPRVVIRSGHIHWIEEMLRGETYIATCQCVAVRTSSMSLTQSVWSGGRKRAQFDCVMVLLTPDGLARMPIPEAVRARLIDEGARDELVQ